MYRLLTAALLLPACLFAQQFAHSGALDQAVAHAAEAAVSRFGPGLTADKLAVTVIDLKTLCRASHHGTVEMYPASVVKLFYLVSAQQLMEAGRLRDSPELERAIHDMIVDSNNDATGLVLDSITGSTSGPELQPAALRAWLDQRNAVNRYFASLGYTGINVNQKTYGEGPYGRERQGRGPHFENNNRLNTDATARLLYNIAVRRAVTPARCEAMLKLLHRDIHAPRKEGEDQAHDFSAGAMPEGAEYYAKAGWTSTTRHDATYVELPNGARYVAVIFTLDNASRKEIIPFVARELAGFFSGGPGSDQ